MAIPKLRVTLDGVVTDGCINAKVELKENDYWTAQLNFLNSPILYPTVSQGSSVIIEVQDGALGGAWTTLFAGSILYVDWSFTGKSSTIGFQCVGCGYPLNMMNVAQEYGAQSRNPTLYELQDILINSSASIIPAWVHHYIVSAYHSGYTLDFSDVEYIAGVIPYIMFPWKPANKCLDDICDLVTAVNSPNAGPHWIVSNDNHLRVKTIGATQAGWTLYYGDSEAAATLVNGVDFFDGDFQPLGKEANVIVYSGIWRRPSSGDALTEGTNGAGTPWGVNAFTTDTFSNAFNQVGATSLKLVGAGGDTQAYYPSTKDADWNFESFMEFQEPKLKLWALTPSKGMSPNLQVRLVDHDGDNIMSDMTGALTADNVWGAWELPIGKYHKSIHAAQVWGVETGSFDWEHVEYIQIESIASSNATNYIDGLHFGNAPLIRIARQEFPNEVVSARGTLGQTAANSLLTADAANGQHHASVVDGTLFAVGNVVTISDATQTENCEVAAIAADILEFDANLTNSYHVAHAGVVTRTANPIRFKVLTDDVGKDDTLASGTTGTTDLGLMAQMAKAELLRACKATTNGKFTTPLIKDILPGQYIHIDKDYRVTNLIHYITGKQATTAFEVTDDLTNSHNRLRYEDVNKQMASMRPEWQDRQASSIKSGGMDIRIVPLEEKYNI
jgi:hypothetical protein